MTKEFMKYIMYLCLTKMNIISLYNLQLPTRNKSGIFTALDTRDCLHRGISTSRKDNLLNIVHFLPRFRESVLIKSLARDGNHYVYIGN